MCFWSYLAIGAAFALLLLTSGAVVRMVLSRVAHQSIEDVAGADRPAETVKKRLEIGSIIGKCENILILVFLIMDAFTALAIVITAKTIVRKEEIEKLSQCFPHYGRVQ